MEVKLIFYQIDASPQKKNVIKFSYRVGRHLNYENEVLDMLILTVKWFINKGIPIQELGNIL